MFPLMSTEGVLGAAWLPTDGYIDPAQLTYALADGARQGGCRIFTDTRVTGIEVARRPRARRADRARATSRPRSWSTPAACTRPRSRRMAGVRVPLIPMSHQYLVTQPLDAVRERAAERAGLAHPARPRPARLLPRGRRRAGDGRLRAAQRAGLPARRAGRARARSRPTSTAACWKRTGSASRRSPRTRSAGSRRWTRSRSPS